MSPSAASSTSSVSGSELESTKNLKRKRKFSESHSEENSDSDSEAESDSGSDSDSDVSDSDSKEATTPRRTIGIGSKREQDGRSKSKSTKMRTGLARTDLDGPAHDEDDVGAEAGNEEEVKVLSHKEQRRLKKKRQKTLAPAPALAPTAPTAPTATTATSNRPAETQLKPPTAKRQNSVWVGNLAFRSTPEALRAFFTDAGAREVMRVHMPTKGVPGLDKMKLKGVKSVKENRGFAYVDFSTPEAKALAISFSERNLDGRRLLIKDGDDFTGRPDPLTAPADTPGTETEHPSSRPGGDNNENNENATDKTGITKNPSGFQPGPTKTAKKILKAQKQAPCPCLFLGNLGFEATEERIRQMFEGHARALTLLRVKKRKEKEKEKGRKRKRGDDDDLLGVEEREEAGNEEDEEEKMGFEEEEQAVEVDVGIKKVRMGTFEDSGACKGFAFVDFMTTAHATAALTNPRNHFLDGRALVVEYASPEAARRGGYGRTSRHFGVETGERKRKIPKRSGENKYNDWKKKASSGPHVDGNGGEGGEPLQDDEENNGERARPQSKRPRAERTEEIATTREMKVIKARENKKERRQKPGAALAQAQREKYAIVPSEGTRLKFS